MIKVNEPVVSLRLAMVNGMAVGVGVYGCAS
jgi:hypothetical protein